MKRITPLLALALFILSACSTPPSPKWPEPWTDEIIYFCWDDNSTFAQAVNKCDRPSPIEWPALSPSNPLVVTSDRATALYAMRAVNVWNEWLGFRALVYNAEITDRDADIEIVYGGPAQGKFKGAAGATGFHRLYGKQAAMIVILSPGLFNPSVYLHEIGHALGLEHDPDNIRSIMYPNVGGMFAPELESQDRDAIRKRYATPLV